MSEIAIDALSRRAAAITLGGTALGAALTGAIGTEAAKNPAKQAKKKAKKKCKRQRGQCLTFLENEFCVSILSQTGAEGILDPAECLEIFRGCCDFFAKCQTGEGLSCLSRR